jgi:hypothetical protein
MYGGQSHDVAGEFWNEGDLGNIECRAASSAAHIYGKKLVSAESYTSAGQAYQRYPAMLKKRGDWSYTEGINQVILHLYIHQPYEDKSPGINAWFGTEFNRKNTWFRQSKNWIDYQRRCMFMLRRGLPVNFSKRLQSLLKKGQKCTVLLRPDHQASRITRQPT